MAVDRPRRRSRTLTLRDGARVTIRPISADDKELLLEAFERLSPESRYRRFLKPMPTLPPEVVENLTDVDHDRHEALVAIDPESGQLIGTARYIRDPEHPESAEVAAAVTDDWQGRGVGRALLERLTGHARSEGVRRFTALVLAENRSARELLSSFGATVHENASGPEAQLVIELPARRGLGAQLAQVLRAVAAGTIDPARDFLANRSVESQGLRWPVDPTPRARSRRRWH